MNEANCRESQSLQVRNSSILLFNLCDPMFSYLPYIFPMTFDYEAMK